MIHFVHVILPKQPMATCGVLPTFTSLLSLFQLTNNFLQSQQIVARAQAIRGKVAQRIQATVTCMVFQGIQDCYHYIVEYYAPLYR